MDLIQQLRELIDQYDDSRIEPVSEIAIDTAENDIGPLPEDLKALFQEVGHGSIGDGIYVVHFLVRPEEVDLDPDEVGEGIYIVGESADGLYAAYDVENDWEFGQVSAEEGYDQDPDFDSFVDYLVERLEGGE